MATSVRTHTPLVSVPPTPSPTALEHTVLTEDGTPIEVTFYASVHLRGAAVIVPAMGVPQSFYAPLARWLAAQGVFTATFDYRGMGASRRGSLRDVDADCVTWGTQDTAAVLAAVRARAPNLPINWIAHSLGGQIVPFVADRTGVEKIITIATGNGYWRYNSPQLRRKVWLFWWFAVPIATPLFGYFPGKRLGMVGDLPRGVIRQWKKWCMQPDYAADDSEATRALYAGVTTPITAFSFSDDEMMSQRSIDTLHALYESAPITHRRLTPDEIGTKRVGHFGFFRAEMQKPLWEGRLRPELVLL